MLKKNYVRESQCSFLLKPLGLLIYEVAWKGDKMYGHVRESLK